MKRLRALAPLLLALSLFGCGDATPPVHPVSGTIVLVGGDVAQLAGHHVEAALTADPTVRAAGVIGPDGRFSLETLHGGTILRGARAGAYEVRFLSFKTSGLTLQVPAADEVQLRVSAK
jgi:hypothetical protein